MSNTQCCTHLDDVPPLSELTAMAQELDLIGNREVAHDFVQEVADHYETTREAVMAMVLEVAASIRAASVEKHKGGV